MRILPLLLGLVACQPSKVDVTNATDSNITQEEPSPITWTDCSSNEEEHPCDFTLKDQSGNDVNLYELFGKPVIVDFSTMWCYYCQMAGYDVKEIADLYDEDDLVYITILVQNFSGESPTQTDLVEWNNHFGIGDSSTPVLAGHQEMISATPDDGWYVEAWPTFYFIDREMTTKMYLRGWSEAAVNAGIETIIQ